MENGLFCGGLYGVPLANEPGSLRREDCLRGKSKDSLANYYKTLLGFNTEVIMLLVNVQKNIIINIPNDS